ncbi:hypothetical protein [Leekyejoonella antrihumi]|nr:hypothetical protein [Leekyejoonella antrihumi]
MLLRRVNIIDRVHDLARDHSARVGEQVGPALRPDIERSER